MLGANVIATSGRAVEAAGDVDVLLLDKTGTITLGNRPASAFLPLSDNGVGLPSGRETAIFDKFTRGGAESSTAGVGLGLAICRAIVEAHGGTIAARTNVQGGATFSFTLPLGTPPAVPAADEADVARP